MLTSPEVLYKATISVDAGGQQIITYEPSRVIDIFIAYANSTALPQSPAFEDAAYVGITPNPSSLFQKQDKIGDYTITNIISTNRFTFLLLDK